MKTLSIKPYFLFLILFLAQITNTADLKELDAPRNDNQLLKKYLRQAIEHQNSETLKKKTIESIEATIESIKNPSFSKEKEWRLDIMIEILLRPYNRNDLSESFDYQNLIDHELNAHNFNNAFMRACITTLFCHASLTLIKESTNLSIPSEEFATAISISISLIGGFLTFLSCPKKDNDILLQKTFYRLNAALIFLNEPLNPRAKDAFNSNKKIKNYDFFDTPFHPEGKGCHFDKTKPDLYESSNTKLQKLIAYVKREYSHTPLNQTLRAIYVCMELILEKTTNTSPRIKRAISFEQPE